MQSQRKSSQPIKLALKWHPDKVEENKKQERQRRCLSKVSKAYADLSDKEKCKRLRQVNGKRGDWRCWNTVAKSSQNNNTSRILGLPHSMFHIIRMHPLYQSFDYNGYNSDLLICILGYKREAKIRAKRQRAKRSRAQ